MIRQLTRLAAVIALTALCFSSSSAQMVPGISNPLLFNQCVKSTTVFLTGPTGSNQIATSAADWCNAKNSIETIGGGGSGGNTRV